MKQTETMETKIKVKELCKGLKLKRGLDGYWLSFEASNGKHAVINLENKFPRGIVRDAILQWANDVFE